jgi:hypothetical protein
MEYEKSGYSWTQDESLSEMAKPERVNQIKRDNIKKAGRIDINRKSALSWQHKLIEVEGAGCVSCFL